MSISAEEIIRRTKEMMLLSQEQRSSSNATASIPSVAPLSYDLEAIQADLPFLEENQFLIDASTQKERAFFCVRELYWHEAQEIELRSFRLNDRNDMHFSGEYERRETLKKALLWGCVIGLPLNIQHNDVHGTLLKKIHADSIDSIWQQYQARVTLGSDEASALYHASQSYFKGEAQSGIPVPPLVIEVDFWMKGVQWTREDFRRVSASDLERIQLILAARSDAFGISAPKVSEIQSSNFSEQITPELLDTFPPHIRQALSRKKQL